MQIITIMSIFNFIYQVDIEEKQNGVTATIRDYTWAKHKGIQLNPIFKQVISDGSTFIIDDNLCEFLKSEFNVTCIDFALKECVCYDISMVYWYLLEFALSFDNVIIFRGDFILLVCMCRKLQQYSSSTFLLYSDEVDVITKINALCYRYNLNCILEVDLNSNNIAYMVNLRYDFNVPYTTSNFHRIDHTTIEFKYASDEVDIINLLDYHLRLGNNVRQRDWPGFQKKLIEAGFEEFI